jgi:hypothetical protein
MKPHEKSQVKRQEQRKGKQCCVRIGESLMTWDGWGRNKWMKLGKKAEVYISCPCILI